MCCICLWSFWFSSRRLCFNEFLNIFKIQYVFIIDVIIVCNVINYFIIQLQIHLFDVSIWSQQRARCCALIGQPACQSGAEAELRVGEQRAEDRGVPGSQQRTWPQHHELVTRVIWNIKVELCGSFEEFDGDDFLSRAHVKPVASPLVRCRLWKLLTH